jgi:hypothetical protein
LRERELEKVTNMFYVVAILEMENRFRGTIGEAVKHRSGQTEILLGADKYRL